ncbi:hypothetical protein [Undibacterium sp. TC9W]|uniref:hypothetical protein n=1 Tax=Undibacterium sp. TC9W TaxID=3413053 RepID=UPI003BF30485
MTTKPINLDLPERDRQPIIKMMTMLYPSELHALKDKLVNVLAQVDHIDPSEREVFEGLCMIVASIKRAINDLEVADNGKAGA